MNRLKRRLAAHRRRLRYWSGLPSFTGFGPSTKNMGRMQEQYEMSKDDAHSIASELAKLGCHVQVVDPKRTFQNRYNNPQAPEVLVYPTKPQP